MTRWLGSAYDWIDERAAIRNLLRKGLYEAVPVRGSWFYTLGSATLVLIILQLVTGIFRGIETLAFALFRVLIQKLDLSRLYSGLRTLAPVPWSYTL